MKIYIFSFICLFIGFLSSCSDDEGTDKVNFNQSLIQTADAFTDPRDSSTYQCVRIGDQIWMTENLRYQVDGNTLGGCYTWEERKADLSKATVSNELFSEIVAEVAYDPQYEDWPEYSWGVGAFVFKGSDEIISFVKNSFNRLKHTQDQIIQNMEIQYPSYLAVFYEKLTEVKSSPEMKRKIGYENFLNAEKANGGYVSKYGFLYSHKGALAAVPEGWRLPSDEDWLNLERTLGVDETELMNIEAWRGAGLATLLNEGGASGFNAKRAGANVYVKAKAEEFINKDDNWYYWSSTDFNANDSTTVALIRMSAKYSDKIWRGTSRITTGYRDILYSVRCVKDAN